MDQNYNDDARPLPPYRTQPMLPLTPSTQTNAMDYVKKNKWIGLIVIIIIILLIWWFCFRKPPTNVNITTNVPGRVNTPFNVTRTKMSNANAMV
jgi:hypothetical protein